MKRFAAEVRVRKQDRNGNTYHDINIYDMENDGNLIIEISKRYGYGRHYEQTTAEELNKYFDTNIYEYGRMDNDVLWIVNNY